MYSGAPAARVQFSLCETLESGTTSLGGCCTLSIGVSCALVIAVRCTLSMCVSCA